MRTILKAKVQEIKVTDCCIDYEGSLTLGEDIIEKLGVTEYEQVWVNSKYGTGRIMTYVIKGEPGSCELNGGAVNHFEKGEIVHLLFFGVYEDTVKPKVVIL